MTLDTVPRQAYPEGGQAKAILELIRRCFASMEGRIDPPSSMHRLTEEAIDRQAREGEVWIIGTPPVACVFLIPQAECLYLGKLAVDAPWRGQGLAARLVEHAVDRARALGRETVEIQVRVELVENHMAFAKMGFVKTGEIAHDGYERPTSVTMRRAVG
ncbi:GNAT family N-acetyltransferase [Roseovarius ramblicola]|uniref:GNAT family N-acetyltransferase n=1 Tax=Roseovarius ramblicola TaxID=2022336 RepID=A0ABV5I2F5_9RHOB